MIDVRLIRSQPELIRSSMARRGADIDFDALADLDSRHRSMIARVDNARAEHNQANKAIAKTPAGERQDAIAKAKQMAVDLGNFEAELKEVQAQVETELQNVPNLVHPDAPPGRGDESNVLVREVGERVEFDFAARDHLEVGQSLGIIDVDRAARVSGSRFGILRAEGAFLELALVRFAIDRLHPEGFVPVIPPVLVRREAMYGTGFFPTDEAQVYKTASDDLYLAGTSEVPIAAMHAGETFRSEELPVRYAGFSTCFRREAGTYGKDTRGIIRVHQFDKVEMFSFCSPESSDAEHAAILRLEEELFQALQIPYRVIEICAGDLADPNYRKFDIEAWLPGSNRWLEVTSCSNDIDYQARRLGVRAKWPDGNRLVHTLNGTAVAVQRAIVAILENHQLGDGSVTIPPALVPYTGFGSISI